MSSRSHVSHYRVLPLGEFTVTIPEPYATLQGAVTWRNQCHHRVTLQCVRIPSAILKIVYRHILFYFLFLMQFRLWRAAAFVSSPLVTRSSAVAKRPRDVSCLSVVSFNSTKRQAQSSIISYTLAIDLPLRKVNCSLLFGVFTGAWLSVPQTDLHSDCDTPLDGRPSVDNTNSSRHRSIARYRPTIVLSAVGRRSVHSMQWSKILAEIPDFCLPHLH